MRRFGAVLVAVAMFQAVQSAEEPRRRTTWSDFGGGPDNARYLTLEQVPSGQLPKFMQLYSDYKHLPPLWRPFSRLHGRFTPASLAATLQSAGFVGCRVEETLGGLGLLAAAEKP